MRSLGSALDLMQEELAQSAHFSHFAFFWKSLNPFPSFFPNTACHEPEREIFPPTSGWLVGFNEPRWTNYLNQGAFLVLASVS